jgi:NAD(P)-dependent dehydrogenase (short-subunit alcohol dehydrogenase family)
MKRILVTGANKGIGLAIATKILQQLHDTHVLLGCRNLDRGQAALESLVKEHPGWANRLEVLEIDVSDDGSVTTAAKHVAEKYSDEATPLFAIVNNAGVGPAAGDLNAVLQVNCFGMRRVCETFSHMLDAKRGRIANLTSAAGPSFVNKCSPEMQRFFLDEKIEWPALESFMKDCIAVDGGEEAFAARGLSDGDSYGLSKACANSYTLLLARENSNLRINACTPGFIETDMTRPYAEKEGKSPADMGMKSPADGTKSALYLLFGDPKGSGHYYGSDAVRSPLDRYREPGSEPYTGTESD